MTHLINEALKPFFMGVEPSDLLDRLRNDPELDSGIKQLLKHPDSEMQRVGLEQVRFEPGMTEKYPELDSDEFYLDTDFVDRSQPAYKREFERAQQTATDPLIRRQMKNMTQEEIYETIKKIAESTFTEVYIDDQENSDYYPDMMILRGNAAQDFNRGGIKRLDPAETNQFINRLENLGLGENIYIQQPHMIILEFDLALL